MILGSNIDLNDICGRPENADVLIIEKQRIRITPYQSSLQLPGGVEPSFSPAMDQLLHEVTEKWRSKMNLYIHNCQHFSGFVKKLVKDS